MKEAEGVVDERAYNIQLDGLEQFMPTLEALHQTQHNLHFQVAMQAINSKDPLPREDLMVDDVPHAIMAMSTHKISSVAKTRAIVPESLDYDTL